MSPNYSCECMRADLDQSRRDRVSLLAKERRHRGLDIDANLQPPSRPAHCAITSRRLDGHIEDTNRPIRIGGKSIYSENASVSATVAYSEWWKRARNTRYIGDETRVSARCKSTGERSGIAIGEFRAKRRIWVRHTVRNTARCRRSLLEN